MWLLYQVTFLYPGELRGPRWETPSAHQLPHNDGHVFYLEAVQIRVDFVLFPTIVFLPALGTRLLKHKELRLVMYCTHSPAT